MLPVHGSGRARLAMETDDGWAAATNERARTAADLPPRTGTASPLLGGSCPKEYARILRIVGDNAAMGIP